MLSRRHQLPTNLPIWTGRQLNLEDTYVEGGWMQFIYINERESLGCEQWWLHFGTKSSFSSEMHHSGRTWSVAKVKNFIFAVRPYTYRAALSFSYCRKGKIFRSILPDCRKKCSFFYIVLYKCNLRTSLDRVVQFVLLPIFWPQTFCSVFPNERVRPPRSTHAVKTQTYVCTYMHGLFTCACLPLC